MKLAILHTRLSGYLTACLRTLRESTGAELLVHAYPNQPNAPFDPTAFDGLGKIEDRYENNNHEIAQSVIDFQPDAILVSGWADRGYLKICCDAHGRGIPVVAGCDTQWTGNLRQRAASWIAPWLLHKAIDVLWVTGERQAILARALGYSGDRLWDGYYACDWQRFSRFDISNLDESIADKQPADCEQRSFLYVGRYVSEKGLDTLCEAYRLYITHVANPWTLTCAGAGPLRDRLVAAGAKDQSFVQPNDLPELMAKASCLILPSRFEPWGVVVHEAAASGLPLICSDACGAAVHLLRPHLNGYTFPTGDAEALADRMVQMTRLSDSDRNEFGQASAQLSRQYTPERWINTLLAGLTRLTTVAKRSVK
jgi:glycosyltransferase involved in cell wall biosynthesis